MSDDKCAELLTWFDGQVFTELATTLSSTPDPNDQDDDEANNLINCLAGVAHSSVSSSDGTLAPPLVTMPLMQACAKNPVTADDELEQPKEPDHRWGCWSKKSENSKKAVTKK